MTTRRYRKKPVVVEAMQFTSEMLDAYLFDMAPLPKGIDVSSHSSYPPSRRVLSYQAYVTTIHGQRTQIVIDDWVITEPDGEHHYPCKPDIFAATYEPEPI